MKYENRPLAPAITKNFGHLELKILQIKAIQHTDDAPASYLRNRNYKNKNNQIH